MSKSCFVFYDICVDKPIYKTQVIVFHPDNNEAVFAKLWNVTEDEKGKQYNWKRVDNNSTLEFEPKYWTDSPVFDAKLIKKE